MNLSALLPDYQFTIERDQSLTVPSDKWGTWRVISQTDTRGSVIHQSGLSFDDALELKQRCNQVLTAVPMADVIEVAEFVIGQLTKVPATGEPGPANTFSGESQTPAGIKCDDTGGAVTR